MKAITKLSRCLTASFIALGLGPNTKATPITKTVNGVNYTLDVKYVNTSDSQFLNYARYGDASPAQGQNFLPWWGDKALAKSMAESFKFELGRNYASGQSFGAWFNYKETGIATSAYVSCPTHGQTFMEHLQDIQGLTHNSSFQSWQDPPARRSSEPGISRTVALAST